jgi:hypothetical protein
MRQIAAALLVVFSVACAVAAAKEPVMRTAASGSYAATSPQAPEALHAADGASFDALWKARIGDGAMPAIDFSRESAVILMAGERRTGGWSVVPKSVRIEGTVLVVEAAIEGPPAGGIVTQALTSPWVVIAVSPQTFESVRWDR